MEAPLLVSCPNPVNEALEAPNEAVLILWHVFSNCLREARQPLEIMMAIMISLQTRVRDWQRLGLELVWPCTGPGNSPGIGFCLVAGGKIKQGRDYSPWIGAGIIWYRDWSRDYCRDWVGMVVRIGFSGGIGNSRDFNCYNSVAL